MISILARQVLSQQHLQKNYTADHTSLKRTAEGSQEWSACKKLAKSSTDQTDNNSCPPNVHDLATSSVNAHVYADQKDPWWWHTQRNRATCTTTKSRAKTMAERLREYRACKKAFLVSATKLNQSRTLNQVHKTPVRDHDQVVKVQRATEPLTNSPSESVLTESVGIESMPSQKSDNIDSEDYDSFNNLDEEVSRVFYEHSYGMNVKQDNVMELDATRITPNVFIKEEFRNSGLEKVGDNIMELDATRTGLNVFVGEKLMNSTVDKTGDNIMELDATRISPDVFLKADKVGDSIMELDVTETNPNMLVEEENKKAVEAREEYYKTLTRIATEEHAKKMHLMDVQLEFYKRMSLCLGP